MRLSRSLAIALVGSTHVSLCTGSVLSVLLALLAHAAQGEIVQRPMTPALAGSVCLLETPSDRGEEEPESACGNGEHCFESVAFSVHKADLLLFPATVIALPRTGDMLVTRTETSLLAFFRKSRPPGHSRLFALSVVQRE